MTGRQCIGLCAQSAVHHFIIVLSLVWSLLVTWSWEIKPEDVRNGEILKNCARASLRSWCSRYTYEGAGWISTTRTCLCCARVLSKPRSLLLHERAPTKAMLGLRSFFFFLIVLIAVALTLDVRGRKFPPPYPSQMLITRLKLVHESGLTIIE